MDYSNLKSKTIYDLCDDEEMLKEAVIVSKDVFFQHLKEYPLLNAHVLIEYAEMTNNKELMEAVEEQYREELDAENNE